MFFVFGGDLMLMHYIKTLSVEEINLLIELLNEELKRREAQNEK